MKTKSVELHGNTLNNIYEKGPFKGVLFSSVTYLEYIELFSGYYPPFHFSRQL